MTVWAAHEVKDDVTPAARFGEIRYVNKFYIHGDELLDFDGRNHIPVGYEANMHRCYAEFNPGADYLLIAGDHLQLLALTALLIGKRGFLDVLRWDRQLRDYIPVRLSSGLVPPRQAMLSSVTPARSGDAVHIGENEHGEESRELTALEVQRRAQALALDGPHRKPPAQDDH